MGNYTDIEKEFEAIIQPKINEILVLNPNPTPQRQQHINATISQELFLLRTNKMLDLSSLTGRTIEDIANEYNGKGYGEFKKAVAEVVVDEPATLQAKVSEIKSSGIIDKVLEDGANKAKYLARKKLNKVYRKIGIH